MENIVAQKQEHIARLQRKVEILKGALAKEEEKNAELSLMYRDLKDTNTLFGSNVALMMHYKKYMQHYKDLYDVLYADSVRKQQKYGHFYKEFEAEIDFIHHSEISTANPNVHEQSVK